MDRFVHALANLLLLFTVAAIALSAQTLTTLVNFDINNGDGQYSALVQGTNGDLYGTTYEGGAYNTHCREGCGTVYKMTPTGTLTTLYSFCQKASDAGCSDGLYPNAGVIQASDGNFYGTTLDGGFYNYTNCGGGCGTVFKITPGGALTTLYSFNGTQGSRPRTGLIQGTDGNFFGSTSEGGDFGYGTIFTITSSGALTTIHSFCEASGCADGADPLGALVQAADGDFYGTTSLGGLGHGAGACVSSGLDTGCGTIFRITPAGSFTTLYSFCTQTGCPDGQQPNGLVEGSAGGFYGTTGTTFFKITPSGALSILYTFCVQSGCPDGTDAQGPLSQGTDGNFYGVTEYGGLSGCNGEECGTIFKITPGGALTTLYSLNGTDGGYPAAGLLQGTNGDFYGTTSYGGADNHGTIFSLSVGLGPFIKTHPATGAVGATIDILGTNLAGATAVRFNGTAAAFNVVSSSEITTTVPAGATSGTVDVTVPSGTLSGNVPFQVLP
jgi:uncharacterized repeat protein (TIGR03803 family)